jgi:hypothetical protein
MGFPGHTSGFKHFLTAVDGEVDVGVKHDDPQEGKGEPYLPLYVSFTRVGDPTLHFAGVTYCLTRTEWVSAVEPSQEDRARRGFKPKPLGSQRLMPEARLSVPIRNLR